MAERPAEAVDGISGSSSSEHEETSEPKSSSIFNIGVSVVSGFLAAFSSKSATTATTEVATATSSQDAELSAPPSDDQVSRYPDSVASEKEHSRAQSTSLHLDNESVPSEDEVAFRQDESDASSPVGDKLEEAVAGSDDVSARRKSQLIPSPSEIEDVGALRNIGSGFEGYRSSDRLSRAETAVPHRDEPSGHKAPGRPEELDVTTSSPEAHKRESSRPYRPRLLASPDDAISREGLSPKRVTRQRARQGAFDDGADVTKQTRPLTAKETVADSPSLLTRARRKQLEIDETGDVRIDSASRSPHRSGSRKVSFEDADRIEPGMPSRSPSPQRTPEEDHAAGVTPLTKKAKSRKTRASEREETDKRNEDESPSLMTRSQRKAQATDADQSAVGADRTERDDSSRKAAGTRKAKARERADTDQDAAGTMRQETTTNAVGDDADGEAAEDGARAAKSGARARNPRSEARRRMDDEGKEEAARTPRRRKAPSAEPPTTERRALRATPARLAKRARQSPPDEPPVVVPTPARRTRAARARQQTPGDSDNATPASSPTAATLSTPPPRTTAPAAASTGKASARRKRTANFRDSAQPERRSARLRNA